MKKFHCITLTIVIFLIAGLVILGCVVGEDDTTIPVPGDSGTVTVSNVGTTSLNLSWTKAEDDISKQSALEYRVYYSTSSEFDVLTSLHAKETAVGDWEADIETKDVTGLTDTTLYYFAVFVRDEAGNTAAYEVVSQETLDNDVAVTLTIQELPTNITSTISLSVTATGMDTISDSYSSDTQSITVEVPSGLSRLFTVLASTPSVTFRGTAEEDLTPGDDVSIPMAMELFETKLVIPDAYNYRIVQIDDMVGNGWTELTGDELGFDFVPYDIDFDTQGRIYISNWGDTSDVLIRIDDITDTDSDTISGYGAKALAIDRENNYIYYTSGSSPLYRRELSDPLGDEESFNLNAEDAMANFATTGISVDQDGFVYLANSMGPNIVKYNTNKEEGSRVEATYSTNLNDPWDVLVRNGYVYVTNYQSGEHSPIVRFDVDNPGSSIGYGDYVFSESQAEGDFYGPHRFVAILNKKLNITDNDNDWYGLRKLRALDDDLSGNGWSTYGTLGTGGPGEFLFYNASYC